MYLDINTSRARKTFKRLLGHTNHYLITLLVSLDYIKKNEVVLPEEFRTSWNPQDKNSSVMRSREFSINATLSWAIDALDAYLGLCHRRPTIYQEIEIQEKAGAAGQSVYKKFIVLRDHVLIVPNVDFTKFSALTELALVWRNKLVHFFAENELSEEARTILNENHQFFHDNFQGLNIDVLLTHFDGSQTPRFKEITSIIRAIHKFVELSDGFLLNKIDKQIHFVDCLDFHLKQNTKNDNDLKSKVGLLFNLPSERRIKSLIQSITNYGFTLTDIPTTQINLKWLDNFSKLSNTEVMKFLKGSNFENKKEILKN